MNHDEHDKLWELLGKAGERKASPFFVNKVMHTVRRPDPQLTSSTSSTSSTSFWALFRRRWLLPVAATACAAIAAFIIMDEPPTAGPGNTAQVSADPLADMVEVIAETEDYDKPLNVLLATEDNSVWLAADPSSLF